MFALAQDASFVADPEQGRLPEKFAGGGMLVFVIRRVLQAVPILIGVSLVVFGLVHIVPGNPIDLLMPPEASPEVIAQMKAAFGFDKPLYLQYLLWLGRAITGDFGLSVFNATPVVGQLFEALYNTLKLALLAAFLGFSLGIAFGLIAGFHHNRWQDKLFSAIATAGVSMPHYWCAIVLVLACSVLHDWLPAQGMGDTDLPFTEQLPYLIMPVLTLACIPMGVVGRLVRATVLEILSREFPGALAAKGLTRWPILRHVCRNAAPPALALMGLQFGYLLGGSILVETVFNWPGSGNLLNLAIFRRDIPVLQATILVLASFFVMLNLLVDIAQAAIDPRLRR
jgi:peptide/nickel transport system permease protein